MVNDLQEVLRTMRKRGTSNQRVCRFFQFFWYGWENRVVHGNAKGRIVRIVYVISPRVFRVEQGGSRKLVWLDYGYTFPRQLFVVLGELLHRRSARFQNWNRQRCCKCLHDQFKTSHYDTISGHTCEHEQICASCGAHAHSFSYGYSESYTITMWQKWEERIFGKLDPKSHPPV